MVMKISLQHITQHRQFLLLKQFERTHQKRLGSQSLQRKQHLFDYLIVTNSKGKRHIEYQMFSYGSRTKGSQRTMESQLIEEIQFLGNEIFDNHSQSIAKTDLQEMSLELSPGTSEQGDLDIRHHDHLQPTHQLSRYDQKAPPRNYYTNTIHDDKPFQHQFNKIKQPVQTIQTPQTQYKQQQRIDRLTKSMVSSHQFKQPGSFSNNYVHRKNIIVNDNNPAEIAQMKTPTKVSHSKIQKMPLVSSNLSKSNILKGTLNHNQSTSKKNTHKKGKFSEAFSSNYVSPYSTKAIKENPKSYLQKSLSQRKNSKESNQIKSIKQKVLQSIEPQISHRIQQTSRSKSKNSKLSNVKSRYKQTRPINHGYQQYADQHIYKKVKEEMSGWEAKKKLYEMYSDQEIQENWKRFIQNQQKFIQNKKQWVTAKKFQQFQQQKISCSPPSAQKFYDDETSSILEPNPYKMTPEDFINKYKREKEKLKEKLQANQISNFLDKTYLDSIKYGKEILNYLWGSTFNKEKPNAKEIQNNPIIHSDQKKEQSAEQKFLIEDQKLKEKNIHENFFMSVGQNNSKPNFQKKPQKRGGHSRENKILAKSTIYEESGKSRQKVTSRDQKSQGRTTERSTKRKDVNISTPLKSGSNYLSRVQQSVSTKRFDPRNESNAKGKSREYMKKVVKNEDKRTSEYISPKYFKSINELSEYSSNSRQRRLTDHSPSKSKKSPSKQAAVNKSGKFDKKLMSKIIEDLNQLRSGIEQNKKKRRFKIENYQNFSNVRQARKQPQQKQQTGCFRFNLQHCPQQHNIHTEITINENNYRNTYQPNKKPFKRQQPIHNDHSPYMMQRSRSISPIEKEHTIVDGNNNRLSVSGIFSEDYKSQAENSNYFGRGNQFQTSRMILVKNKQQVEFMFENQQH